MKMIFAGTDSICNPTIKILADSISLLVAPPSRPRGRGNKIQDPDTVSFVKEHFPHIEILQTENINLELAHLMQKKPQAILVFSFAQFFKKEILNNFPVFNIHTSLLPKYRGASPIHAALLNRDLETGVSIQRMQLKLDTGPVLLEKKVPIAELDDFVSLKEKLSLLAASLANEWWGLGPNFPAGTTQEESQASYAGIIKKEDGRLTTGDTQNLALGKIRAYSEWPGSFINIDSKYFKITKAIKTNDNSPKGKLSSSQNKLLLGFEGGSLEILEIQPESKPKMTAQSFMNGYKNYLGRMIS